ncbi:MULTISPECIES: hypothetical protein [Gemmobacter]|jgi:hypothetical protein|uniref:DUF4177 domain-containing protein n=2 Tax=Gemmobacter TaxID=204456 RepID=A0A2T6ANN5_9RHOB|nr:MULTISPECIES: hypothetical protein [Gemmobacter]OJY36166.1 MAG: hypothetical protein BGP11_07290 [Rhodobacterales bacterium 65-51]PTX45435.1 hypothetical protein C8N34_12216 [Gemmobacter caeni]TWI93650.1 hypothetical protein IQ03_04657 [Gemmobacter caeni]GHC26865.1 hypothetical protein GCM10007291_28570 [Gemmobacter nanjingensis]
MIRVLLAAALACLVAMPAAAECYADYKAKQDNPLRLHYGVAQVSACNKKGARAELAPRLAAQGWKLLNIVSTFGPEGLNERRSSAGDYFLRY